METRKWKVLSLSESIIMSMKVFSAGYLYQLSVRSLLDVRHGVSKCEKTRAETLEVLRKFEKKHWTELKRTLVPIFTKFQFQIQFIRQKA